MENITGQVAPWPLWLAMYNITEAIDNGIASMTDLRGFLSVCKKLEMCPKDTDAPARNSKCTQRYADEVGHDECNGTQSDGHD